MTLYHLTCDHGRKGIGRRGTVAPNVRGAHLTVPGVPLVWLTSEWDVPPSALGLTSFTLGCNRTEFVYAVDEPRGAVRWVDSPHRTQLAIQMLEAPGTRPELWWVSSVAQIGRLFRVCGGIR